MKKTVALISLEKVGGQMAGPGIRYFELSEVLSKYFNVILLVPKNEFKNKKLNFHIKTYDSAKFSSSIIANLKGVDFVITQSLRPNLIKGIKQAGIYFIADLYDPYLIEGLEHNKLEERSLRNNKFEMSYAAFMLQLCNADHILCSSERQKDFYTGILCDRKIINPDFYERNKNVDSLISILPFGIKKEKPISKTPGLIEKKFVNIKKSDKVILWGGGVWNWFDPISVIKAIEKISLKRKDVKLLFMGLKHPDPKIKQMKMTQKTIDYCKEKGLLDKTVFINHDWTPYEERVEYLLRANIGVSTHFNNLETRFSYRTRILDYIWAELPIVATEGDTISDMIRRYRLGEVVGYENVNEIAASILNLLDGEGSNIKRNIKNFKETLTWDKHCLNLVKLIENDLIEHRPIKSFEFNRMALNFYKAGIKNK